MTGWSYDLGDAMIKSGNAFGGTEEVLFITNLFVMDMSFVCRTQPYNPKITGTQQVILYAMSFFTTIACRLPVFTQRDVE